MLPRSQSPEGQRPEPAGLRPLYVVGDTGIEPVTSSVSGKRAPAAPIARGGYRIRTGVNGFAGRCLASRPTHHENAGARRSRLLGADDGTRTRDPHLGKVMLYQLSHIRMLHTDHSNRLALENHNTRPATDRK